MQNAMEWLDRIIAEQATQRDIIDSLIAPYPLGEVADSVTEETEPPTLTAGANL